VALRWNEFCAQENGAPLGQTLRPGEITPENYGLENALQNYEAKLRPGKRAAKLRQAK
jgi:hypothetical protein